MISGYLVKQLNSNIKINCENIMDLRKIFKINNKNEEKQIQREDQYLCDLTMAYIYR